MGGIPNPCRGKRPGERGWGEGLSSHFRTDSCSDPQVFSYLKFNLLHGNYMDYCNTALLRLTLVVMWGGGGRGTVNRQGKVELWGRGNSEERSGQSVQSSCHQGNKCSPATNFINFFDTITAKIDAIE